MLTAKVRRAASAARVAACWKIMGYTARCRGLCRLMAAPPPKFCHRARTMPPATQAVGYFNFCEPKGVGVRFREVLAYGSGAGHLTSREQKN